LPNILEVLVPNNLKLYFMSNFKTRLIEEKTQLEEKLDKLDAFLLSEKVQEIDDVQKALLQVQATAMNTYLQCLKERLERLGE